MKCDASKFVRLRFHKENKSMLVTLTIPLIILSFLALSDLEMNITGWCADVCCNSNTEERCYDPPSCALVGITHTFLFDMHSSNSFPSHLAISTS